MDEAMEDGTSGQDRKTYSDDQDRENYTVSTEESTPRVWIGCLACYNAGALVGEWYPAIEAGDVTPANVHARERYRLLCGVGAFAGHEELWVMDHENLPITGECSPADAQRVAEMMSEIESQGYPVAAVVAFLENEHENLFTAGDDAMERFEEAYAGEWDSFRDYADELADESIRIGVRDDGTDDFLARYFNYDQFARDLILGGDNWTEDAPGGGVFVFRAV